MRDRTERGEVERGAATGGFVGREAQLDVLALHLTEHASGPRTLLVHGDPGIGKTRLLAELGARMSGEGWRVVWGRSWDEEGAPPYWLWTQVARDLQGLTHGTDLAQIVLDEPDGMHRLALFDATAGLLRRAAAHHPVLIVLDDLHAADVPSLLLTRFVTDQLLGARVSVIGTYRPREAAARPEVRSHLDLLAQLGVELPLDGLELEAVAQLLGDELRASDVHELTGGNPLFVEQVVRSHEGHRRSKAPNVSPTTDALLAAIGARIEALAPGPKRTLTGIAVLGGVAEQRALARLLDIGAEEVQADLGELVTEGLVDPTAMGTHPSLHALVADAALAVVSDEFVARLHHRAATQLIAAGGDRPGEIAYHLLRAGPGYRREAAGACRRAAGAALASTAYEDAVAHYERALRALGDDPAPDDDGDIDRQRLCVLLELGRALRIADRGIAADEVFARALELSDLLDDPESRALAALRGGVQYFFAADLHAPLEEQCRAALESLPAGDVGLKARLLAELATRSGPTREAGRALADEAVAMARRLDDPVALGTALVAQQVTALGPDTLGRRLATAHEILTTARTTSDPPLEVQGKYLLFGALVERGDLRGFDDELASGHDASDDLADRHRARLARWLAYIRATFAGRVDLAETIAERALAVALESNDTSAWRVYGAQLGVIRALQDRSGEMEPLFEAQRRARPRDPIWPTALGYALATQGRFDEARATLSDLDPDAVPLGMSWLLTMVLHAEAAVELQDDSVTAALRSKLLPFADRFVPVNVGAAAWGTVARPLGLLARHLGRADEAIAHFDRAVDVCAHMGARPWLVQAQLDLAETLLLAGRANDDRVGHLVTDASRAATELGLRHFAERALDLRASTGPGRSRADARSSGCPTVSVLGTFEVTSSDGVVAPWTSRKARELLKILVAQRGAPVHREVLMDLLWPDVEVAALGNRLSVALSTVRRALDPDRSLSANELITTDRSSVRLRTDRISVDSERFLTAGGEALAAHAAGSEGALELLVDAIKLHRGPALPDEPYAEWASPLQSEVWTMHLRVARALGDRAIAEGHDLVALEALRRLSEADPLDEVSARQLIDVLEQAGAPMGGASATGHAS